MHSCKDIRVDNVDCRYLKEVDIYERCMLDVQREKTVRRPYSHRQSKEADVCGCLCFSGRRN